MSHVFPRHSKAPPPRVASGDGCYLIDTNGKRYLDGAGGAAVSCLGYSDTEVVEAVKAQLDKVAFAHTSFFTSDPAEELADLIVANAPEGIERVYFVSGGSEAVEAAIKLTRQYFLEIGQSNRSRVIARRQSYHGNTLGALSAGGNAWRRAQYAPLMIDMSHIAPCYEYRDRAEGESLEAYGLRVANELEEEILRVGPETVMAFIAEPVVGGTIGAVPGVEGYYKRIREICDQYGILLILDEVMCGMGRTGSLFACEQDGITADIITIAKAMGSGYQPIGAMLCSGKIYDAIEKGSGFFQHGHTYLAHPAACAGSLAVVKAIINRGLVPRVKAQGAKLRDALNATFGQHPNVGDIRGRGLFMGIELVEDRATKKTFDPKRGINKRVKKAAFDDGLMCYPMGGTIDGINGDHILLAPPYIIEDAQIDELVSKLSGAVDAALTTG